MMEKERFMRDERFERRRGEKALREGEGRKL